jgi:hypothetical protein
MRAMKIVGAVLMIGLLAGFAGCAKAPVEVVASVQTAIDGAKSAGADMYASDALAKVNATFQQAKAEIDVQNGKFALLRSYKNAEALLVQAQTEAQQAQEAAVAGKERARVEANTAIDTARAALQASNEFLAQAPHGKNTKAELDAMQQELTTLQTSLDEATGAMAGEDYINAKIKADLVTQKANEIQADVQAAIAKVGK